MEIASIVSLIGGSIYKKERIASSPRINYSGKSCNYLENHNVRFLRRWATIIRALDANCRIYYGTGRVCIWEDLAFRGRIHPVDYASSVSGCPFSFDFWISRHCCPGRMPPPAPFRVAIQRKYDTVDLLKHKMLATIMKSIFHRAYL